MPPKLSVWSDQFILAIGRVGNAMRSRTGSGNAAQRARAHSLFYHLLRPLQDGLLE